MEPSEEEPPPPAEPAPTEQPADAATEKPEGEPGSEQPEPQEAKAVETPEGDVAPEQPENQVASEAVPEQPEGEPVSEPPAQQETVDQLESAKPEGEPAEEAIGEPSPEQPETEITVHELELETPESQVHFADTLEQTDEEFIGSLVDKMVCEVVGQDSELDFIGGIVKKIVAHAVGEESSEESELTLPLEKFEEIEGEDVTTEVLKYLLGPESLRYEIEPHWRPEIPPTCINFMNVIEYARKFVDDILEEAKEVCFLKYGVPVKYHKKQFGVQNIRWPSIESFTVELGTKKIDEYIQMTFEVEENWLYKINFIAAQSDLSSDVYLYEAIFCIPTPCYPVAQATVSIYFNCDVSRVKPPECPIDVTYTIESLKEILVPGKTVVNDDMLLRLVYSKLSVFKSLYF